MMCRQDCALIASKFLRSMSHSRSVTSTLRICSCCLFPAKKHSSPNSRMHSPIWPLNFPVMWTALVTGRKFCPSSAPMQLAGEGGGVGHRGEVPSEQGDDPAGELPLARSHLAAQDERPLAGLVG